MCAHEHCLSWQALGTVNCNKNENCTSLCKEAALGVSAQIKSSSYSSAYVLEECVIVLWRWTTHPLFCADFCWMCLGDWKTHGSEYYECSRYKENPDIVNQSQQAQAREALKKYLFYFERVGVSSYPCLSRIGSSSDLLRWDHWDAMCTWKPLSGAPAPASWALPLGKCSFSVMQDNCTGEGPGITLAEWWIVVSLFHKIDIRGTYQRRVFVLSSCVDLYAFLGLLYVFPSFSAV